MAPPPRPGSPTSVEIVAEYSYAHGPLSGDNYTEPEWIGYVMAVILSWDSRKGSGSARLRQDHFLRPRERTQKGQ